MSADKIVKFIKKLFPPSYERVFLRYSDLTDKSEQKFENLLLYLDFVPDIELPIIMLEDGSFLVLFQIDGADYEELSEEPREDYSQYARAALELLPNKGSGFILSNLLVKDTVKPIPLIGNPAAPELVQFIQGKKQGLYDGRIQKNYSDRILCGLSYRPIDIEKTPPWHFAIKEEKWFNFYIEKFNSSVRMLEQGYAALSGGLSRFKVRTLTREESYAALYELINFSPPKEYQPKLSLKKQLLHKQYSLCVNDDYLAIDGTEHISLVGIKSPPPHTIAMHLQRFYEFGFPLILRRAVDIHSKKIRVWEHFFILVRAGDKKTLSIRRAEIISLLKKIGLFGDAEELNIKTVFVSMLPGQNGLYTRSAPLHTTNPGDFLRACFPYPGDSAPVDYLQDRFQGVFSYNPFAQRETAHHRAVCGSKSDGKRLFVVNDLISHIAVNPMLWVVDLSASYLGLFESLKEEMPADTAIMRVSRDDADFAFNPFFLAAHHSHYAAPEEQIEFCMSLLKIMAGTEFRDVESEATLREGLIAFFDACGVLLRNRKETKPIQPLSLLSEIFEKKLRHSGLANALLRWTTGRRGEIFNTGCDTLQSARYSYFDLSGLENEPELVTAIVFVILSKVHQAIADESLLEVQKRLVLDEARRYIADPSMSPWIQKLCSADRRRNFMLDLIADSINDLIESDAILKNLKQAFFFPGQKDIEESFRKLRLKDYHIEQYKDLDPARGEVFYWADGGLRRILRSVANPYAYWLATTDAAEREMKRSMKERRGNAKYALEELVRVTAGCQTTDERLSKLKTYFRNA